MNAILKDIVLLWMEKNPDITIDKVLINYHVLNKKLDGLFNAIPSFDRVHSPQPAHIRNWKYNPGAREDIQQYLIYKISYSPSFIW